MRAEVPGRILLAVDGEPQTDEAMCWALDLALGLGVPLNLVHIRDPYLKQFYNEIYSQGREEYLEYVQQCLEEKAQMARSSFESTVNLERILKAESSGESCFITEDSPGLENGVFFFQ